MLATQNPIELEGTYPLPEAQLDRFLFKVTLPPRARRAEHILTTRVRGEPPALSPVLTAGASTPLRARRRVHLPRAVADFIGRLVAATHPASADAPEAVRDFVRYGGSPRAALALARPPRALALLRGKPNVGFDEVRAVALPALNHRLVLDYGATLEGSPADGSSAR